MMNLVCQLSIWNCVELYLVMSSVGIYIYLSQFYEEMWNMQVTYKKVLCVVKMCIELHKSYIYSWS